MAAFLGVHPLRFVVWELLKSTTAPYAEVLEKGPRLFFVALERGPGFQLSIPRPVNGGAAVCPRWNACPVLRGYVLATLSRLLGGYRV